MDRRLVGALLVVVVLSAAIIVPLVSGRRVAGTALPIDLPDPPRVGDCLLNPLPASDSENLTDGTTVDLAGYPAGRQDARTAVAVFGPCDGPVSGEVVQVVNVGGDTLARRVAAAASDDGCRSATAEYTGLLAVIRQFTDTSSPGASLHWDPTVNVRHMWVQPEALQRAAGRTWLACGATPSRPVRYVATLPGPSPVTRFPISSGCVGCKRMSAPH